MRLQRARQVRHFVLVAGLVATLTLTAGCGDPCADVEKLSEQVQNPSGKTFNELNDLTNQMSDAVSKCSAQKLQEIGEQKIP